MAPLGGEGAPLGGEGAPLDDWGAQLDLAFGRLGMALSRFLLSARIMAVEGDLGARGRGEAALPDLGSFGLLPRFFRKLGTQEVSYFSLLPFSVDLAGRTLWGVPGGGGVALEWHLGTQ